MRDVFDRLCLSAAGLFHAFFRIRPEDFRCWKEAYVV